MPLLTELGKFYQNGFLQICRADGALEKYKKR
jgi:hypothetical protein